MTAEEGRPQGQTMFKVKVWPLDGEPEEYLTPTGAQVGPGFLFIPCGKKTVGWSLHCIRRWESWESPLSVPVPRPIQGLTGN